MNKSLYRITKYTMVVAAMTAILTSCHYKEFDEFAPKYKTRIIADYSLLGYDHQYTNMRTVLFPLTAEMDYPYQVDVHDTTIVSIPEGEYRVLAFSNDGLHETYNFDGYSPYSASISVVHANNEGLPDSLKNVYDYPDRICAFDSTGINVVKDDLRPDWSFNDIFLHPQEITRQVRIHLYGIQHPEKAEKIRFTLDNLPLSYRLAYHEPSDSLCTMIVKGSRDFSEHSLFYGNMNVFGTGGDIHHVNALIEGPGFKIIMNFDVTEQIKRQANKQDIVLELYTNHDLYDDIPSGFKVDVNDWDDNEVIINM